MQQWFTFLRHRLQKPLPGHTAHRQLMPELEGYERPLDPPPGSRKAAVLVAFLAEAPTPTCILTLRSAHLLHHRSEWSFPGGMLEEGESPIDAALREAAEEIAVDPARAQVLGTLTPLYVPASHAAVVPVVAALSAPVLQANPAEVEQLLFLSLEQLRHEPSRIETWYRNGRAMRVPLWHIHPRAPLWGATAMILNELLWLYEEFLHHSPASLS